MGLKIRVAVACLCLTSHHAMAQITLPTFEFVDVTSTAGLQFYASPPGMAAGVAVADIDDDGDLDFYLPNDDKTPAQLYRNEGGHFVEVAAAAGLDLETGDRVALWIDTDGDGDLDLFTANDIPGDTTSYRLHRQDPGFLFTDVTASAGVHVRSSGLHRGGLCAGDINQDGNLDIYCAMWDNESPSSDHHLFLNDSDGTFTDISLSSGIMTGAGPAQWQPVMYDFNGDGWLDISVAVDFTENHLWINQTDNTFVDIAAACGADILFNDMGQALGDFDQDGDFDVYLTNIHQGGKHNVLLRNESNSGSVSFTEVSHQNGVEDGAWGWGCTFFDADNDGDLDLAATNGFSQQAWLDDRTRFFMNRGRGPRWYTKDLAAGVGLDDDLWGSCLVAFDYDRDGDQDLLQTTLNDTIRLLENRQRSWVPTSEVGRFLVVKPRMPGANRRAIGAEITAQAGTSSQIRVITAGISCLGQEPAEACFGFGTVPTAADVSVNFPDGQSVSVPSVPLDGIVEIAPPPLTYFQLERGSLTAGGVLALRDSDDVRWAAKGPSGALATVLWEAGAAVGSTLTVTLEARSSDDMKAQLLLKNHSTGTYESAGSQAVGSTDTTLQWTGLDATKYLRGDGRVELRIDARRQASPFADMSVESISLDHLEVMVVAE